MSHDAMRAAEITPEEKSAATAPAESDDAVNANPIPTLPGQTRSLVLSLYALPMTRAQVARYLRRSIATVRRAEGHHLHPYRDAKGIFRFDPDEVRELRVALDRGEIRLTRVDFMQEHEVRSRSLTRDHADFEGPHRIAALQQELADLRDVSSTLLGLFYSVCPARFLSNLDPELLDTLDAIALAVER